MDRRTTASDNALMEQAGPLRNTWTSRVLRWLAAIVVGLVLLTSLTASVLLYRQGAAEYREMKQVRLDPMGLHYDRFPPELPSGAMADEPLVVFFGDSRAQGWWPPPQIAGWRFANRGIYGQTTAEMAGRLSAQVLPLQPRVIVLQAGINDLTAIGVFPDKRDQIVSDCARNLRDIINQSRAAGVVVIVTTIFPVGPVPLMKRPLWSSQIPDAVREVNRDLLSIHQPGVIVFDTFELLQDGGKLRLNYAADTLHLNAEGYAILNVQLRQQLKTIGTGNTPVRRPVLR